MEQFTVFYQSQSHIESLLIMQKCLDHNFSFEFLNKNEFYFFIYDEKDFQIKQTYLSEKVISESNKVN